MTDKIIYTRLCWDCGEQLYPHADGDKMGAITISIGECPRCKKPSTNLIPVRDLETNNEGAGWD